VGHERNGCFGDHERLFFSALVRSVINGNQLIGYLGLGDFNAMPAMPS
jgi:hypothetical protein